jgi:hypothetical protein
MTECRPEINDKSSEGAKARRPGRNPMDTLDVGIGKQNELAPLL